MLGLIFLKFADNKYKQHEAAILAEYKKHEGRRTEKTLSDIPADITGDMFGQIYEYFLGDFAMSEGHGGGEFFTPRSVVSLMVEIIEPHGGRVFDPACGSAGMFVQSAQFVEQHRHDVGHLSKAKTAPKKGKAAAGSSNVDIYVCGQEKP